MSATDHDLREFRRILAEQRRVELDQWRRAPLRAAFAAVNRILSSPVYAVKQACRGTYRHGIAVTSRHGVNLATQFLQILVEALRSGLRFEAYYQYQLYLPNRWRDRKRQFSWSQYGSAQKRLIKRDGASDAKFVHDKNLFAIRCQQAGLPSIPTLAEFANGQRVGKLSTLPARDLISKPARGAFGQDVALWRYDPVHDLFANAVTDRRFSSSDLFQYFCDISQSRKVIVQERLLNHDHLLPLTNGALHNIRLLTCRSPSGSIDLMPPVIRVPAGRSVAANLTQGGLAAPIDLAIGVICGPALQWDNSVGVAFKDRHPDTRRKFKGSRIPMWKEALDLALRAHQTFPSLHFVGWDIAIVQDGPVLIEGNGVMDTDLSVLPHGINLSDTQFIPYYNYHWNRFR